MTRTRLLLRSRSAVLLTALYMAVFFSDYQHAAAVKLDRKPGSCWEITNSSDVDATSDTSAPSGQPAYRILNKIDENVYIGANETLRKLYITANNTVGMEEIKLETDEPAGLIITCAKANTNNPELDCWNYIRIVERTRPGDLLVCGTNALSRICYQVIEDPLQCVDDCTANVNISQLAVVPTLPDINAVTAIINSDMLYGGDAAASTFNRYSVQADLSTANAIEFELDTVTTGEGFIKGTPIKPTFIGRPFEYTHDDGNEYVFLFYREIALEYTAGDKVYSRIARVCKNDTGGTVNDKKFVTFIKARLECSVPNGDEPAFEYDYIQDVVWDADNTRVYAVFTNQENGPATSALCQYRMEDIMNLFDNGYFQKQETVDSKWNEVADATLPRRPGTCHEAHTTDYPPLLYKSVPSYNAQERTGYGNDVEKPPNFPNSDPPILNVDDVRFTSLSVDLDYSSPVYFVGTSTGNVIKFSSEVCDGVNTTKSVEVTGLNANGPINGLELMKNSESATFLVGTSDAQASIEWPLNTKCQPTTNAEKCGLKYPYCSFTDESNCTSTKDSVPQDPVPQDPVPQDTPTEIPDDVLTVFPNTNASACLNDHVYWFCHLDIDNPAIGSTSFTLQWDITASEEITMTNIQDIQELVQLDVIVQNSTVGSYSCTADVGGRVVTKQVEISMKTDCLTCDNLSARLKEYNTLKSQNEALHVMYGNGNGTCSVKRQDCATVDLTCPTSP